MWIFQYLEEQEGIEWAPAERSRYTQTGNFLSGWEFQDAPQVEQTAAESKWKGK